MTRREVLFGGVALAVAQGKTDEAIRLIQKQTDSRAVSAASLYVRSGSSVVQRSFGAARSPDAVFLLASITKPMTVTGVMVLVDRQEVKLDDPVQRYLPEFRGDGRERVLVRHLLTHTSGLPDMLPENEALRKRHAPLSEFVAATCRTPLLFNPGSEVRYQSMGILLAAEIVQRLARQPFPDFLREQVFRPLQMQDTTLGLGTRTVSQTMQSQVDEVCDWDWNSAYWRNLASPWGGAHAPTRDVATFLGYFSKPDDKVLKPATATAMITDQTEGLGERYGLGWRLQGGKFARGCSARAYGHSGSTGTLSWFDPARDLTLVLLTTKPAVHSNASLIQPVSDLIAATGQRA